MSFRELLLPEHFDMLMRLKDNDVLVAAWYKAVTNPLQPMKQDMHAIMWLVQMLCESKNAAFDQLLFRKQTELPLFKLIGPDEILIIGDPHRPETCAKFNVSDVKVSE